MILERKIFYATIRYHIIKFLSKVSSYITQLFLFIFYEKSKVVLFVSDAKSARNLERKQIIIFQIQYFKFFVVSLQHQRVGIRQAFR